MKVRITSLGCRLNQSEIQSVATQLQDRGHTIVKEDADVIIVNSCAVTVHSERKTRKLVNQAARELNTNDSSFIIVTGCTSQEVMRDGNTYYVPNDYKHLIPEIVDNDEFFNTLDGQNPTRFPYQPALKSTRTRINLKIQDGCDNFCSYCIIPYVRGVPQNKPYRQLVQEFRELIEAGYKEVLLTGVMIGHYNDQGRDLAGLIRDLLQYDGEFRLHLSSLSPIYVNDELVELFNHDKMVKHLHLSLQSGSDGVLQRMNRKYTAKEYLACIDAIKRSNSLFNFTTDVIVGFPGETSIEFDESLDLIREVGFSHIHTFRYSPRPGTAAAKMKSVVEECIKNERSKQVVELYTLQKKEYYSRFDGTNSVFLSERYKKGKTNGFNEYYIPVEVYDKCERNRFYDVSTRFDEKRMVLTGNPR